MTTWGIAIGAVTYPAVSAVRQVAIGWQAAGRAQIILGSQTTPALASLINGTMTHAADFDDNHPVGAGHPSGPFWSTALALGYAQNPTEQQVLAAFISGYEIMARSLIGAAGIERTTNGRRTVHCHSLDVRYQDQFQQKKNKPLWVSQTNRNSLLAIKLAH